MNLSLDHPTNALYQRYVEPRLRAGETVKFCARWRSGYYIFTAAVALLLVGLATLDAYYRYYIFETVQAACGDEPWRDCGKFYEGSRWVVPVSAAATIIVASFVIAAAFGWHKQLYIITDQRVIVCRIGIPRGFDAFELPGLTYRRGWFSLNIGAGWRKAYFFLDRPARDAAEACLAAAIEGSRK